ncbi:MAG: hypothetical protein K940chlam7_00377 [Chlamydiae bacterium]|nr:hypothetical protein [Chlamydiota bacterium]
MNILVFVMSMLMLLALLTYGRLESFRNFAFVQSKFKKYMEHTERQYVNDEARKRYDSTPATEKEKKKLEEQEKNLASSKLSFNLFVNKEERAANTSELETHINVAKNLMSFLYGDQPFYQEIEEQRPDFLNEIINALIRETENFTPKKKLKKTKEIATIDFGDAELNNVFTKMLKGSKPEDEKDERLPTKRFKPSMGYYSLQDFITVQSNKLTVRVFLAPPQLLMAVYGNEDIVQQILETRCQLYLNVKNKALTPEQASQEFQSLFLNQRLPNVSESMLNFGVSLTYPKKYQ